MVERELIGLAGGVQVGVKPRQVLVEGGVGGKTFNGLRQRATW